MIQATIFSPCRQYRYTLWRSWIGGSGYVMFIGLNPSTADETRDDPTIRRCINYAKSWGYSALCMTNIFAFRATKPADMKAVSDPIGLDNDAHLIETAKLAGIIIAAWGSHGAYMERGDHVKAMLDRPLHCLAINRDGHPAHPLYLSKNLPPMKYYLPRHAQA